jgi:hypothetical protein
MPEIIKHPHFETHVEYTRHFTWRNDPGRGFAFPSDERGEVDLEQLKPEGLINYRGCIDGSYDVIDDGPVKYEWEVKRPGILKCECGEEVEFHEFTNTCDKCGRDYDYNGRLLAPRSQWGEETGETWQEIMGIGWRDDDF